MITIKSRKWLDEAVFKEILRIADYKGYIQGEGSIFIFNLNKALRSGYMYEDVVLLIQTYGLEIDRSGLEELKKLYSEVGVTLTWNKVQGLVEVSIPYPIYNRVRDVLRRVTARFSSKSRTGLIFRVLPYSLYVIKEEIEKLGIKIIDKDDLLRDKPLPISAKLTNINLRNYQVEALEKWINNGYKGIIALPTGSGKTIIGIAAITKTNARTIIITYTREQMFQWRDAIIKYTNIEPYLVGLMYSEEKRLAPITITTYQSGFRLINEVSPFFDFLLVDEVHHLPAEKFRYIALHSIARYRMGLSATPIREDGKHEELFPLLGGIVYYRSPAELAKMGYLAHYKIYTIKVKLTREEKKLFEDLRKQYRSLIGYSSFQEVLEAAKRGNEQAKKALRIHSQLRMLMARSKAKIDKAVEIAKRELSRGSKIIVFTQYVDQAKTISRALNAYLLTGEVPVDERKRVLHDFREATSDVLVVTTVGDEGLDIPDANVGIIVSGTGSRRQFIQRLGRLLRPKGGDVEARLYEIVLERTPEEAQARKRKKWDINNFLP
ncbi:MAG: ATP-dependent helicase [Thermoprotei archaeon]|nr:MAG: ATP-dependent helicase [Thermoprotei archaeon]